MDLPGGGTIRLARSRRDRNRTGFPARRAGEGRQRSHRWRGAHGQRREPAGSDAPDQGQDPRAADRPAARRSNRPVLRSHAADRRGDRHCLSDRDRGDDLGVVLRAGGAVARANLADHRQHDSAGCALVVSDHGGYCGGWAWSTSRPTRCRSRVSPSRSACWSIRRS